MSETILGLKYFQQRWIILVLCLVLAIAGCDSGDRPNTLNTLNSSYTDEQPALSGNGRFLAFVSNRNGRRNILLYDLQQQQLLDLPRLNRRQIIADESPSLSRTGRYLVYIGSDQARPIVALYDRATQQSQILTPWYLGGVRHPSISPDGRYIAFESISRGEWDIEVLDRGPNIELDLVDGVVAAELP